MKVSIVTTLYYSEGYLEEFYSRIHKTVVDITTDYEIIFVNDGSPDNSAAVVLQLQQQDPNIVLVDLSRNFGHHQAILTGLVHAHGDYVFLIDSDLEEDPELLATFEKEIAKHEKADVIYGVQQSRKGDFFERSTGSLFYKLLNVMTNFDYPSNTLTARLMKKSYVEAVLRFREKTLDVWAIFVLAGFNQIGIPVLKKNKGISTYTFFKKVRMSVEIITSVSHRPLYLIFFLGLIWLSISSVSIAYIFIKKLIYGSEIEGWASIMASVWLIGGIVIFMLGIIGIYLSKIFLEVKDRPLTVVKTIYQKEKSHAERV